MGRVAYEIMQTRHVDASSFVRSVDKSFFVAGGAHPHYQVAVMSYKARNKKEIDLHVGDRIYVDRNLLNGLSQGHVRNEKWGYFPSFKVQDTVDAVKMPTYPEVKNNLKMSKSDV